MGNLHIVFGKNVRFYRKRLNLTQAQLSELIDVSPSFIGYIENGITPPSFKTIELLSIALQVSPGELFEETIIASANHETALYNPSLVRFVDDIKKLLEKYTSEIKIPEQPLRNGVGKRSKKNTHPEK